MGLAPFAAIPEFVQFDHTTTEINKNSTGVSVFWIIRITRDMPMQPEPPCTDFAPRRYRLTPRRHDGQADRRRTERELAIATQLGHFLLQYQPRVRLQDGRSHAAEALIRWPHRKQGMIPPAMFLPLAEESGQIVPIGAWVLRTACREARGWRQPWTVSVNVSPRQLVAGTLLRQLAAALEETGLPPERLELELPESHLVAADTDTLLTLSAVRDIGIGLALDDFGHGFASLAVLKRLPLTAMKLDRSLVRGLPADQEDAAIVRAVIAAGHALGLTVTAEGIETELQRDFLAGCGCDDGQGTLFSQPLPADQMPIRARS